MSPRAALAAPAAGSYRLQQVFTAGERRVYAIRIASHIASGTAAAMQHAALMNRSRVSLRVLGVSATGTRLQLRYLRYTTQVSGSGPLARQLRQQAGDSMSGAMKMPPLLVLILPDGSTRVLSPPGDAALVQARNVLIELVRDNYFPTAPVGVGAQWSRRRRQAIGIGNVHMFLQFHYHFIKVAGTPATAAIHVITTGQAALPARLVPNHRHLTQMGFVLSPEMRLTADAHNQYRLSDGALVASRSQSQSTITIKMISGLAPPQLLTTQMKSTGRVRLLPQR